MVLDMEKGTQKDIAGTEQSEKLQVLNRPEARPLEALNMLTYRYHGASLTSSSNGA
jgi:hypothetical protein